MPLASQLREVNAELKHNQADVILDGGFVPEFICTEFYMSNLDRARLKNSLLFELPRRLPILPMEWYASSGRFLPPIRTA